MVDDRIDDDEYVANILKQDAKQAAKNYKLVGMDAFNPKSSRSGAPKPNTNFLRQIIRQTDSHNAALLAKEAEESRARLKSLNRDSEKSRRIERERERRAPGRLTPPAVNDDDRTQHKRRRIDYSDDSDDGGRRHRRIRRSGDESRSSKPKKDRESDRRAGKRHEDSGSDERFYGKSRRSRHHHDRERRHQHHYNNDEERSQGKERESQRHRHRRSPSRTRFSSPRTSKHHISSRHRSRSYSPRGKPRSPRRNRGDASKTTDAKYSKRQPSAPESDSDPLEAIVGPLPPPAQPAVRSRGRGAHKAHSMGMDARFSSTYDPTADVQLDSDLEDDWGDAVESFRDRQKWKQQGAARLKEAGFTDEQVEVWEKGDEKNEDDVVWTSKGQAREWDRGKVVDEDGDVELRASWGRLNKD